MRVNDEPGPRHWPLGLGCGRPRPSKRSASEQQSGLPQPLQTLTLTTTTNSVQRSRRRSQHCSLQINMTHRRVAERAALFLLLPVAMATAPQHRSCAPALPDPPFLKTPGRVLFTGRQSAGIRFVWHKSKVKGGGLLICAIRFPAGSTDGVGHCVTDPSRSMRFSTESVSGSGRRSCPIVPSI
jgi:hypothetical protein